MAPPKVDHLSHDFAERPRCAICAAGRDGRIDLPRIEKLLCDGNKISAVARRYGLSSDSLSRHWAGISPERRDFLRAGALTNAMQAKAEEEKVNTVSHLQIIRSSLYRALAQALELRDHSAVAAIGNALTKNVSLTAQLIGEWVPSPSAVNTTTVNILQVPDIAAVLSNITRILAAHPAARAEVIAYLRSRDAGAPLIEHHK